MNVLVGRFSAGFWRSKKQWAWTLFLLAGFLFMYVQFFPAQPLDDGMRTSQQRILASYAKDGSKVNQENNYAAKVKFLGPKRSENYINLLPGKLVPPSQLTIEQRQDSAVEVLKNKMEESSNQNNNFADNPVIVDTGSWSDGVAYKYNTFGEPVYNHGNRANYIPKQRVVHFDLKGAPPKISAFKTLIPWLAQYGATAVLLEYEDMFPWEGSLAPLKATNHYSKSDVEEILGLCRDNKLEIIPLVQTFGHLEYALKHAAFASLREDPDLAAAICPSRNESIWLVKTMIDQVMYMHKKTRYLHIGCDEVFTMGECEKCRLKSRESLFIGHVSTVAQYVKQKYNVTVLIWHDMLTHVSQSAMNDHNFGNLVEPMVWVYAEDVYRFAPQSMWSKFSQVFPTVWAASAFKGAFKEQATAPNVRRHLDNNLNWLDVMAVESNKFKNGFAGLVLTGWQRFDHFAVVCELLPAAIPCLAVNLISASHGFFNSSVQGEIYKSLNCMQNTKYDNNLNIDSDPFLWESFSWCFFPGSLVFKTANRLEATRREVDSYVEKVTRSRGWITDYNRRHNFSAKNRIEEDLEEMPSHLHSVNLLLKSAKDALREWFDVYTVGEWIELHIWPMLNQLENLQKQAESMKLRKTWPARPFPVMKDLAKYGITENEEPVEYQNQNNHY